ncbi:MAG: hypothetical protein ACYDDD_10255, partial [Acidithiobacillus ferrivorans]
MQHARSEDAARSGDNVGQPLLYVQRALHGLFVYPASVARFGAVLGYAEYPVWDLVGPTQKGEILRGRPVVFGTYQQVNLALLMLFIEKGIEIGFTIHHTDLSGVRELNGHGDTVAQPLYPGERL